MNQPTFPSYLLDQSISNRVAYFENYKVNHPKLQQVFKLVMDSIRKPDGASLISVYGPTGVGKTTLRLGKAFKSVLLTFQRHLPLDREPDFVSRWDYFYERSLGCVGILKDWLTRTLRDCLEEGENTITDKHLKRRAWSVSQCKRMLQEIEEGEKQLEETEQDVSDLRKSLGLDPDLIEETTKNSSHTKKKSSRRVGQRKPKRDSIGVSQNAQ